MIVILALVLGAMIGIGGLLGISMLAEWWDHRKAVSPMDQDKAGRLLYEHAVFGAVDTRDESLDYRLGYEYCLSTLFGSTYSERAADEAEKRWDRKRGIES